MLEDLLRATDDATRVKVLANVERAVARRAAQAGQHATAFIDSRGLRGLRYRVRRESGGEHFDPGRLATLIRRLRIRLEEVFDLLPPPWDAWRPASTLHVIVGQRSAVLPGGGTIEQPVVGARDFLALQELNRLLRDRLGLDAVVQEHLLAPSSEGEVVALLERLALDARTGGIACVGGPNVNPASDALARRICEGLGPEELPARFRWSRVWAWTGTPFLTDPVLCSSEAEGLHLRDGAVLRRPSDRQVIEERRAATYEGPYEDHGMVLVDARRPCLLLCLCGHGGWGTVGAVWALEHLAGRVTQGRLGANRAFEVVTVDREKRTDLEADDLLACEEPILGWDFHWPAPGTGE